MRLSMGLEQKLAQKQILAPRMIQSMEILQLPLQALEERIEQEMTENPLLEAREKDPDLPDQPEERENPDSPTSEEKELVVDSADNNSDDFERLLEMDQEWPGHFDDGPRRSAGEISDEGDRKHDAMANVIARSESLHDHLNAQLGELELSPEIRSLTSRLVSSLDNNGYLAASLHDLLPLVQQENALELAEEALAVIQSLDPPGVGARNLQECLLLQIKPDTPFGEQVRTLVNHHLDDLKDNRLPMIRKKTGYSIDLIQVAWEQLRKLNPKPGAAFSDNFVPNVNPDVIVDRSDDGSYKIRMEEGRVPRLRISNYYRQRLMNGQATPEEREFIKRKINSAQWLIESIQQRRSTLSRVAQAIVDHQTKFLEDGPEYVEPLKMQQIADKVGVHVTTISRAVDDKYIQTPRGIFPLKRFFVGGTKSDSGADVTWDAIRIKLQEVIDHEDKSHPLSDDDLVSELKSHGLNVARRTITKYRQKMDIPSSRQRRDWTKE